MNKCIFLLFAFFPLWVFSQKTDVGAWYMYLGTHKINNSMNLHTEIQHRNYNFGGDLEQFLMRTGLGLDLSPKVNVLLGYAYIVSENYKSGTDLKFKSEENRIFQQLILKQKEGSFFISHRYRFEERFVGSLFKLRLRYLLSISIPLNKKELTAKTLYISAYNEVFINTKASFFDRDRIFGGLGYYLNPDIKLEFGLMNQITDLKSRYQFQLSLINSISFYRQKSME